MVAGLAGPPLPSPDRPVVRPVVGVIARAPSSEGKSRLIQQLGTSDGAGLRTALLQDTLAAVAPIDAQKAVLYTPLDGRAEIRRMTPSETMFVAQRGATLGERMRNGASDLLACGFGRVVLVGADLPTLPSAYIVDALERLTRPRESLVLGPAEDGGYYLIGLTHLHDEIFDGIPWGTPDVLRRTQEAAAALRLPVELLPIWYDVDRPSDLQRVRHRAAEGYPVASYTRAWLELTHLFPDRS
jgi:rSAM/selenodomain-associated transferase 1